MAGGRQRLLKVKVSDQELTAVRRKASRLGVSAQRLLIESALIGSEQSVTERRALYEELMAVRRLLAALGNNVNQIARATHATGQTPPLDATATALARMLARADAVLSGIETLTR